MRIRRRLVSTAWAGALVLVLAGGECPGTTSEEILYCFVLNSLTGGEHGVENCQAYEYEGPLDHRVIARYEDDLRAYQAMVEFGGATGPGVPTPAQFMAARYADWPERAASLRAALAVPSSVPTADAPKRSHP